MDLFIRPALADPEALDSVPELREELARANDLALKLAQQLFALTAAAHRVTSVLAKLMALHAAGDVAGLVAELERLNQRAAEAVRTVGAAVPH